MEDLLKNVDFTKLINNKSGSNPLENNDALNKLNDVIDKVNTSVQLNCDAECQKNKKEKQLYEKYLSAKKNKQNAPEKLEEAEDKFYKYSKGDYEYNRMKREEYQNEATKIANVMNSAFNKEYNKIIRELTALRQQQIYTNRIDDLVNSYTEDNTKLNNEISEIKNTSNIANRKTIYYNDYVYFFKNIANYIYIFNIILLVLFIILAFYYKKIDIRINKIILVVLILNLLIPYTKIIKYIYSLI